MDTDTKITSNAKVKKSGHKNEKTKKMDKQEDTTATLDQVCRQVINMTDEEGSGSCSSTDSEDLVVAINYNTITSLAALKDIIQGDNVDTPETDSFFQHYFMNHCNNLSSRSTAPNSPFPFQERRRLSQCREEDEDDEKKESDPPPSAVSSEAGSETTSVASLSAIFKSRNSSDETEDQKPNLLNKITLENYEKNENKDSSKRMVIGARHKFLVTTTEPPPPTVERALRSHIHNAHTVHFGTKGAEEQRPSVRSIFAGQNLHRDKNYFDSSLIEIRSTGPSVLASSEDIWVKRTDANKQVSFFFIKFCYVRIFLAIYLFTRLQQSKDEGII